MVLFLRDSYLGELMWVVMWLFSLWVYSDWKNLRKRGVNVWPGLVAGLFLLAPYFLGAYIELIFLRGYQWQATTQGILDYEQLFSLLVVPLLTPFVYLLVRSMLLSRNKNSGIGLNPAPLWTFWFYIFCFFLPLIVSLLSSEITGQFL